MYTRQPFLGYIEENYNNRTTVDGLPAEIRTMKLLNRKLGSIHYTLTFGALFCIEKIEMLQ